MKLYLTLLISFLVSCVFANLIRILALKFKILDIPDGRKIHKEPTPLLGGLSIYLGLVVGLLLNPSFIESFLPILAGSTLILILGLANDIKPLSAKFRLSCQTLISLAIVFMGVRISFLPTGFLGDIIEIIITLLWLVGVTNAYNYLDGLDGLATGSAVINLSFFAAILYKTSQHSLHSLSIILIASTLGFMPYNLSKKFKVFLGEGGSTFLGFLLACIALIGDWAQDNIVKISIPILILGVPIFDMIFTTIVRIKEGKVKTLVEWFEYCSRDHFHHHLVDLGFRPPAATIFIYFVTFSLGISAIMVNNDLAYEGILSLFQASIIFGIIASLIIVAKKNHNG